MGPHHQMQFSVIHYFKNTHAKKKKKKKKKNNFKEKKNRLKLVSLFIYLFYFL